MFTEKVQMRVKISGHDTLSTARFSAVKPPDDALDGAFTDLAVSLFQGSIGATMKECS